MATTPAYSTTGSSSAWTVRDPDGTLIAVRTGATSSPLLATEYFPLTDNLGNVRAMVTATGTTPDVAYTYSAYGVTTSTTGTLNQPYRYGSGYTDITTGLVKLGMRYYDPVSGRFTQQDPTGEEQHPYLYAGASPVTFTDPDGDFALLAAAPALALSGPPGWVIGGAIAVAAVVTVGILYAKKKRGPAKNSDRVGHGDNKTGKAPPKHEDAQSYGGVRRIPPNKNKRK